MIYDVLKVTGTGIWQKMGCDPNSIKNSLRKEPLFFCSYHQADFYFPPYAAAAAAASLQSCLTLCDPIDNRLVLSKSCLIKMHLITPLRLDTGNPT